MILKWQVNTMSNNNTDPSTTHTLEEFVSTGKTSSTITYYTTSILDGSNGIHFSIDNVVFDYMEELKQLREPVRLTTLQHNYYKYDGVYLLSYDLYGTRDLAYLIMALNGIYAPKDFNMNPLYLIGPSKLSSMLNAIYNAEKEYLNINRSKVGLNR